jgi:TetR/AcrR family transcriptional regulator, transcriptional repressor for nem operon
MKETREYIIDESYKLFLNHSYEAVSISMISEAIGFTKGALYHHFRNKEELFRAVIDTHFPLQTVTVDRETITLKDYTRVCIDHTQGILEALFTDDQKFIPVNYLSLIADCFRHYDGFIEQKNQVLTDFISQTEAIIGNAIKRGEIRSDVDVPVIALYYFSLSIGLAGDLIRNNSVKSAVKSLTAQLNQLYALLIK